MSRMFQVSANHLAECDCPAPYPYQVVFGTRIRGSQCLQLVWPRQGLNGQVLKAQRQPCKALLA